jgi:Ser/Thr protein kinase RdoA (MazF antagonist)
MSKELVQRILQRYGYSLQVVQAVQKGYRNHSYAATLNSGETLNLILYKREPGITGRIENANRVGDFLAAQGFPARRSVDGRLIRLQAGAYVRFGSLYTYLPGRTIPWEAYTMEHIKQLGAAMSSMHAALKDLDRGDLPAAAAEYKLICGRMQAYFQQSGVKTALKKKLHLASPPSLKKYAELLDKLVRAEHQQALHMDFVRGNILFDEHEKAKITGILDFEKTVWGDPAFDIARTLAFLIVDCKYKDEAKVRKYFLHSGYNKRGRSTFVNWQLLEPLVNLFLIYDFYKFLRHNPYEYLEQNEHFVRTRNFLLNRNVLSTAKVLK